MSNDSGRRRPSISAVVAVLALVVAVAGTAVAAPDALRKLDKKETKQVKKIAKKEANKRISKRAPKLNVNSADSAGVADTANLATAIAPDSVKSTSLGTLTTRTDQVVIPNNAGAAVDVECNADEQMITGGTNTAGVGTGAGWAVNRSNPQPNGWDAAARNDTGSNGTLIVEAVCLAP